MKVTYGIIHEEIGSYEHRNGDIVGIDNRVWVTAKEVYRVRNNKTRTTYRNVFIPHIKRVNL